MAKILIKAGEITQEAEMLNTKTAEMILEALPIQASANTWGDEIYFGIPVTVGEEDSQDVVEMGDLAYWPPGNAFCIFFGKTPASRGNEIRPASAVNIFGRLLGDPKEFKKVPGGATVTIEKLD